VEIFDPTVGSNCSANPPSSVTVITCFSFSLYATLPLLANKDEYNNNDRRLGLAAVADHPNYNVINVIKVL